MSINYCVYIHLHDDTDIVVRENRGGGSITADIKLGDDDVTLFVSSHQQIDMLLRALAEAGKMIPVHVPAHVEA